MSKYETKPYEAKLETTYGLKLPDGSWIMLYDKCSGDSLCCYLNATAAQTRAKMEASNDLGPNSERQLKAAEQWDIGYIMQNLPLGTVVTKSEDGFWYLSYKMRSWRETTLLGLLHTFMREIVNDRTP